MEKEPKPQSQEQFNGVHVLLEMSARALNQDGYTMQDVVKAIRKAEIRPTKMALKEVVWKPLLEIIAGKKSTTKQSNDDIQEVYEVYNKWLGQEFGIHIPFPKKGQSVEELEEMIKFQQAYERY